MNDGQDDNIGKGMCTGLVHSMLSLIKMLKIFLGGGLKVKVCTLLIFEIIKQEAQNGFPLLSINVLAVQRKRF